MDNNLIGHWVSSHQIEKRSLELFWKAFHSHPQLPFERLNRTVGHFEEINMSVHLTKIYITVEKWPVLKEYVMVPIALEYQKIRYTKTTEKKVSVVQIGWYRVFFRTDGTLFSSEFEWF